MSNPEIVHLGDIQPRANVLKVWEKYRHSSSLVHGFAECLAEFIGVFLYVYAGVGSQLLFILGPILQEEGLSSVFQIGCAYAAGIVFAVMIALPVSGGQLSPGITIAFVFTKGFPPLKAVRYIVAQILGAYIACLLIYVQYRDLIVLAEGVLSATPAGLDAALFTPQGPAGAFGLYVTPGTNLGRVFLNEFICDLMITLVIFSCLDPTNMLVPPFAIPLVIGLAYAVAVWGYSVPGLAANTARDLGGRLAAMTIWGMKAGGGKYAAIAALTNIVATFISCFLYELFFADYARVVSKAHLELIQAHQNHARTPNRVNSESMSDESDKGQISELERA
ncbi:aquaporin-like protein [Dendrothele bispora CBS 962.96]|uniref:Aquaporin-like protein n=1 Tax=Dendrothele bispora (strain CBS 962.96) TaxID=1314807 RepID=A0A4S8MIF3_DENBC|nr:aquaporin-like protein [Dendrothele bispora CBS 962.96]